jgi:predicted alpha/beta-fold hydrolase
MNYRGVEIELKTPRAHSATNYEDLDLVVKHVHNKFKDHKILAVGISLGGIKLGGYMAEQCGHCLISYALIVSAPLNINISNSNIERPRYLLFNRYLARERKKYIFA